MTQTNDCVIDIRSGEDGILYICQYRKIPFYWEKLSGGALEMNVEYRLILKKDDKSILEDTIVIEEVSVLGNRPNSKEFEKKIREYIRGLTP